MSYYDFLSSSLFQDQNLINELIKTAQDPKSLQIAARLAAVLKEQMSEPGKELELPNNTVLDKVPQIFDLKNPGNPGNIPLYAGNLKSAADFRQWLANNNIVIKTDKGRTTTINERGNFDQNAAVQFIYNRAEWDSRNYVPENKTKALAYFKKVKEVASEIQYTPHEGQQGKETPSSPEQTQQGIDVSHLIMENIELKPFNSEAINLSALSEFCNNFAKIRPGISGQVNQINTAIGKATQMMNGSDIFRLGNLNINTIKYQYPQLDSLTPLLIHIVSTAGDLYQQFSTQPIVVSYAGSNGRNIMQQQLESPLRINLNDLTNLNNQVAAAKQKRGF